MLDDGFVGQAADPIEPDPAVTHPFGQVANGGRFRSAETTADEVGRWRSQHLLGRDRARQGGDETAMDGGRSLPGQLLVDDDLGQGGEPGSNRHPATTGWRPVTDGQLGQHGIAHGQVRHRLGRRDPTVIQRSRHDRNDARFVRVPVHPGDDRGHGSTG